MEKKKKVFNLSPSSLNKYYESPLLFYLTYIARVPDDTPVPVCYGLSGEIVHEALEKYAQDHFDVDGACLHLAKSWEEKGLKHHLDLKEQPLNQTEYLVALLNGVRLVDKHERHECEEKISFPLAENENFRIGMKGIIDLQCTCKEKKDTVVIDYKTSNSVSEDESFLRQALFYNLLIYKKKGFLPERTIFYYLKLGVAKSYTFTLSDLFAFEEEINRVANEILKCGDDISRYPIGNIDSIFNSKKQACLKEVERRKNTRHEAHPQTQSTFNHLS